MFAKLSFVAIPLLNILLNKQIMIAFMKKSSQLDKSVMKSNNENEDKRINNQSKKSKFCFILIIFKYF